MRWRHATRHCWRSIDIVDARLRAITARSRYNPKTRKAVDGICAASVNVSRAHVDDDRSVFSLVL